MNAPISKQRKNFSDYSYFRDVSKFQKNLTRAEEEVLFTEYTRLDKEFKQTLLASSIARINLLELVKKTKDNNRSIAKLHSKFDNNKSGHNQAIIKEMNRKLGEIKYPLNDSVAEKLYDIGFSKEVYATIYNSSFHVMPEKQQEKLTKLKEKINEIESKLTCSALMMAISIAQKYTSNIFNMDIKDAIQEATIGVYESVNLYDPSYRTKNGKKIKFSTYANIKAEKRVKEKIMETSRLIRLPKSRLDVLFTVLRVCANLEELDVELITRKANELVEKRKKRKLKPSEMISEERITEAITLLNNNCIMLDSPVEGFSETPGDIKTFSDVIPDSQLTAEDTIIQKDAKKELVTFIKENLDYLSEQILIMRYIEDPPKSHQDTADALYITGVTKKKLSKESIRQKETLALKKLKDRDTNGMLRTMLLENISIQGRLED